MPRAPIRPTITFKDLYGDVVYCGRASPRSSRWLSTDPVLLNARTGGQLCVVGDMPALCSRGAVTPAGLDLLAAAGLTPTPNRHTFSSDDEYYAVLSQLAVSGRRLAMVHAHLPDEVPDGPCLVPRELLVYLNNKANLGVLVAKETAPRRRVIVADDLAAAARTIDLPVVLKAATDESTGGGDDVRICRSREDVQRALPVFAGIARIVAEELLEIRRNLCLSYAVLPDGSIRYLGSAEQVSDEIGQWHGSWIDDEAVAPEKAVEIGAGVGARGAALGYRGIYGLDIALVADGRSVAFDLNFRPNGSTGSLLLRDAVCRATGARVIRLLGWEHHGTYAGMLDTVYRALDAGYLLPFMSYDPRADGFVNGTPRLGALLLGATREEISERERELTALGFV